MWLVPAELQDALHPLFVQLQLARSFPSQTILALHGREPSYEQEQPSANARPFAPSSTASKEIVMVIRMLVFSPRRRDRRGEYTRHG
jgi:hypothetical protein